MRVSVVGKSKHNIDYDEIKEATTFYLNELIKDELLRRDLCVRVKFEPELDVLGFCEWTDQPIFPCKFDIMMNVNFKRRTILKSIAHETVHIKQMAQGELHQNFAKFKMMKWKGKNHKFEAEGSKEYYYSPWEIEANGLQEYLLNEYMIFRDMRRRGQIYDAS